MARPNQIFVTLYQFEQGYLISLKPKVIRLERTMEKNMDPICNLLARNLGKPNGELCPTSTPFDKKLALNANSYLIRRAESNGVACGLPGEPSCDEIASMARYNKKKIVELNKKRNDYLEKIDGIPSSCFITSKELSEHYGIMYK